MAEVFKAVKSGPDGFSKTVALKKIIPVHSDQAQFIRMLSTEAKIHSYLNHPNIVQILDFFEEDGQYSMVLEYVDGKNLKEILQILKEQNQKLPWQACLFITLEILKALSYAHLKDGPDGPLHIIHRDVSPHNILISFQGEVKLSDFGIARAQIERDVTASGVLKGKYRYVSPEQILGEPLSPSSDLFSVAVSLYEMLTLKYPFGEQLEYQTLQKIIDQPHISLTTLLPDIDPKISQITDHSLQKNPEQRYQNARDFYEDLLQAQDPNWISHGHELMSEILSKLIPIKLREDLPIEKTSVLAKPIVTQHSLFDSVPTIISKQSSSSAYLIPIFLTAVLFAFLAQHLMHQNNGPVDTNSSPIQITANSSPPISSTEATLTEKKVPTKNIKPQGKLNVDGPLGTHVYVNGKNMGDLPLTTLSLAPGYYTVLLDREKQGQQIKKVNVNTKETATISWK